MLICLCVSDCGGDPTVVQARNGVGKKDLGSVNDSCHFGMKKLLWSGRDREPSAPQIVFLPMCGL